MSPKHHPFNRVFVASVGLAQSPVDENWHATERDHIWFGTRSTELSRDDHLFVLAAGRRSAVLGCTG